MSSESGKESLRGVDDLYTPDFLFFVNDFSDRVTEKNDYVNEFFIYFLLPLLEVRWQSKEKSDQLALARLKNIFFIKKIFIILWIFLKIFFYLSSMPFYVLVKFKKDGKRKERSNSLAVLRSPASY